MEEQTEEEFSSNSYKQKDIFQNILCTVITRIVIYKTFQVDLLSNNFCLKQAHTSNYE